jgi:hypothetical protein
MAANKGDEDKGGVPTIKALPRGDDHYARGGSKVKDFFIGFGIPILSEIVAAAVMYATFMVGGGVPTSIVSILLLLAGIVLGIVYGYRSHRRYIIIGVITSAVLPLVVFGACLIALSGLY